MQCADTVPHIALNICSLDRYQLGHGMALIYTSCSMSGNKIVCRVVSSVLSKPEQTASDYIRRTWKADLPNKRKHKSICTLPFITPIKLMNVCIQSIIFQNHSFSSFVHTPKHLSRSAHKLVLDTQPLHIVVVKTHFVGLNTSFFPLILYLLGVVGISWKVLLSIASIAIRRKWYLRIVSWVNCYRICNMISLKSQIIRFST